MSKTNTEPMQPDTQASERLEAGCNRAPDCPDGEPYGLCQRDDWRLYSKSTASVSAPARTACMSTCLPPRIKQGKWRDVCWPVTADFAGNSTTP